MAHLGQPNSRPNAKNQIPGSQESGVRSQARNPKSETNSKDQINADLLAFFKQSKEAAA
jgi:hypothetical protein